MLWSTSISAAATTPSIPLWPSSRPAGPSASCPYTELCKAACVRAALGSGSTGALIHQSLGNNTRTQLLGSVLPSFQALTPLEFALHCFHFIPLQRKVLILVILFLAVAFFAINIQALLERKKQL